MTWLWLLAIPLFAAADRVVGGAGRRSLAFGAVALSSALAAWLSGQWLALGLGLTWIVYRSLPWAIGGTTTPRTIPQIAGSILRHAMPMFTAAVFWINGAGSHTMAYALGAYAVLAAGLAVYYAAAVDDMEDNGEIENGDLNDMLEFIRGGLFGAAVAAGFML